MRTTDHRCVAFLFLAFCAILCLAKSAEWWEEKPVALWSSDQALDFLNNSPWVGTSSAYFRQPRWATKSGGDKKQEPPDTVFYQARILTAKPIREAFLRLHVLETKVISTRDLKPATSAEESRKRTEELLASYPNDLLIKGDEKQIILGVSQKVRILGIMGEKSEQEIFGSDELSDVDQSTIASTTSLATNTGKKSELANYRPPATGAAGALYFFPRSLPDGTPLLTAADKELFFETVLGKRPVKFRFDLGRMRYQGKLEF